MLGRKSRGQAPIGTLVGADTRVHGDVEFSGAVPDIRANGDITITVKDPRGRLNIQATGNITVNQVVGKTNNVLKVGQVVSGTFDAAQTLQAAGNVTIRALNGVSAALFSSRVLGETCE